MNVGTAINLTASGKERCVHVCMSLCVPPITTNMTFLFARTVRGG